MKARKMPRTSILGLTAIPESLSKNMIWTCIAVTCSSSSWAKAVQNELEILQKLEKIHKDSILIVVEDPEPNVGSGGATLNALLVIAEKLAVKLKRQVISSEILSDAKILILHQGRQYPFDVCSKALVMLPCEMTPHQSNSCFTTNLEHILNIVQTLQIGSGPGLWVCSTDMVVSLTQTETLNFENDPDGIMVCVPADIEWALDHGTVAIDQQGNVQNVLYGATKEDLIKVSNDGKTVPLVCGIVYLSPSVAETLLSFHELSPLDCCTYMGIDSGDKYLRISLFFDILLAMSTGLSKADFMSGKSGKVYNKKLHYELDSEAEDLTGYGRTKVWESLNKFKLKAKILESGYHNYWNENKNIENHLQTFKAVAPYGQYHSICESSVGRNCIILNSSISPRCKIGEETLIQHSSIRGQFKIGDRCFISNANITTNSQEETFVLKDDMCLLNFPVKVKDCDTLPTYFSVLIGNKDRLHLPPSDSSATYLNERWEDFFAHTGIEPDDIWPVAKKRSLFNARLFPAVQWDFTFRWFQKHSTDAQVLERWKIEPKLSIEDIMDKLDPLVALHYRREMYGNIACEVIESILIKDEEKGLISFFKLACSQGWSHKILTCLDVVAQQVIDFPQNSGNLKRILFAIADLLGCMGGNDAGIRSGPAGNKTWDEAFTSLSEGKYLEAINYLSSKRGKWLEKPEQMLRAARHYEKAASIIIQRDVSTAKQFIKLKDRKRPPLEVWVKSECPVRGDVFGAWTDTPPQCYEFNGSVINISFNLFSKKPIGAKGRLIPELRIDLVLHAEGGLQKTFCLRSMEHIMDFNRPNAPAALLKAAIIATGIIDLESNENFEDQLLKKLSGGFELHSWSDVPLGSGLGTSSILAASISATLWTMAGKSFIRRDLIHVVLIIEQLLTTGGGWQDQVGGVTGGVCRGYSEKGLPLQVKVDTIKLSEEKTDLLNKHLILIYTGKVRLARNILQNTIRNWYAKDSVVVDCLREMNSKQEDFIKALLSGDLKKLGEMMNRYWELKKIIAPGCEPVLVKEMMTQLQDHVYGQILVGAGGGGFLCAISKQPNNSEFINNLLKENGHLNARVYESSINMEGITLQIGEESCDT